MKFSFVINHLYTLDVKKNIVIFFMKLETQNNIKD